MEPVPEAFGSVSRGRRNGANVVAEVDPGSWANRGDAANRHKASKRDGVGRFEADKTGNGEAKDPPIQCLRDVSKQF
jgi:hypothetical protein